MFPNRLKHVPSVAPCCSEAFTLDPETSPGDRRASNTLPDRTFNDLRAAREQKRTKRHGDRRQTFVAQMDDVPVA